MRTLQVLTKNYSDSSNETATDEVTGGRAESLRPRSAGPEQFDPLSQWLSMQRADAVVFDLDGTLIDSRVPFVRSMNHTLSEFGLPELEPEQLYPYIGPPTHDTFTELVGGGDEKVARAVAAYREHYAATAHDGTTVYEGIHELLTELHGQVPLAIATSKMIGLTLPLIKSVGLDGYFDVVSGPTPDAVAESKAQTLERALTQLRGPAGAVMVGDRSYDVVGAKENHLRVIGVLWGAGSKAELDQAGADHTVTSPSEIPALIGF